MAEELAKARSESGLSEEALEALMVSGDLERLTASQRAQYYKFRCERARLDPTTSPFGYMKFNGILTLYAKKNCAEQLARRDSLSFIIVEQQSLGAVYMVHGRVTDPTGRTTDNVGAEAAKSGDGKPLAPSALAGAVKKATTQAYRRAILSHCGLELPDESDMEGYGQRIEEAKPEKPKQAGRARLAVLDHLKAVSPNSDGTFSAECPCCGHLTLFILFNAKEQAVMKCSKGCNPQDIIKSAGLQEVEG